jgi:hypothetical protein
MILVMLAGASPNGWISAIKYLRALTEVNVASRRRGEDDHPRRQSMSALADAYRERARTLIAKCALTDDRQLIATGENMVRAYESLAQAEEWLNGEVTPNSPCPQF